LINMMKTIVIALAFGAASAQIVAPRVPKAHGTIIHGEYDVDGQWAAFKAEYHKLYSSPEEELKRYKFFETNLANADAWNDEQVAAGGKPVFGVTKFMDKSQEEFDAANKGRKDKGMLPDDFKEKTYKKAGLTGRNPAAAPREVDWTAAGYVTPVKNQGQCGSCWAHSATEQIESQWMLAGNPMWPLSVQQVNSCTGGTFGCGGGDTTGAYTQLISGITRSNPLLGEAMYVPGVSSAAETPYVQSMYNECTDLNCTLTCDAQSIGNLTLMGPEESLTGPYVGISSFSYATPACSDACADQDLATLNENVATVAPASVCVNAGRWNLYVGGVMTTEACGGYAYGDLDHCVQLTGYDLTASEPYYLVRNSWATNWGNDGYIYLSAAGNTCGLADEATFVDIIAQ